MKPAREHIETKPVTSETGENSTACNVIPLGKPETQVDPALPCPASETASPTQHAGRHHFKYAGRTWRLFKRSASPDAAWNIIFQRDGRREPHSLRTTSLKYAQAEAKALIDRWLAGHRRPDRPQAIASATIADVERLFAQLTIRAAPKARREYFANFRRIARPIFGDAPDVRLDQLTDAAGAKFFAWVETATGQLESQAERARFRKSWLGMFKNALALFQPRAEYQLRKLGLAVPDLRDWRNAAKLHGPQHLPHDSGFAVPDDAVIRRTLVEWVKLGRTPGYCVPGTEGRGHGHPLSDLDRRNMFLVVGLELAFGLRKSEMPRVRWRWFKVFNGIRYLTERDTQVKNASGEVDIPGLDPFHSILVRTAARNGWTGAPDDLVLTERPQTAGAHAHLRYKHGGHTDRTYWPFYLVGKWLRWLGWETQKTNHALRDYAASQITMRYSLADASEWCRHSNLSTTQRNYNRFVQQAKRINAKSLAWLRWAK